MTYHNRMSKRSRMKTKRKQTRLMTSSVLPKEERLPPIEMVSRIIVTMKQAPHASVVDVGFDAICRMHGYIPMRVLGWLLEAGYVVVDDSHLTYKVIALTSKGWLLGMFRGGKG